ncbi:MAG: hypothetical protein QNK37_13460 [Acidobacteriota bacterium]|nr:hypothetical protein [Acidobacteriota bacterium]
MATEPKLKDLYRHIEVGEAEMGTLREGLAARLSRAEPRQLPSRTWIWTTLAAAAVLLAGLFLRPDPVSLPHEDLESLEQWVQANGAQAPAIAERLREADGLDGHNAVMVLCLTLSPVEGVDLAAEGLQNDPRPEFRFFYAEYLLDHADEYRFNEEIVDNLIDRETDPHLIDLLVKLLRFA